MRSVLKYLKLFAYIVLIVLGVTFAVSNREQIHLTFYPLPYAVDTPLFLFTIVIFAFGILLGWGVANLKGFSNRRLHKQTQRHVDALKNEVDALRSEQYVRPPEALPRR